jgi:hemolysin activation/secretion protein
MLLPRPARYLSIPLLSAIALPAAAQTAPPAPPTRDQIDRGGVDRIQRDRGDRVTVQNEVERAPCPLADPRFANVSVTISDVHFDGLKVVAPEALRSAWSDFAGRSVPVATVCEIRDRAATILRREGYLAAVQVPPQRIEDNGVVRFDVLMAKLVRVQVRGDAGRAEAVIARQLEKLQDQPVFNTHEAERYLLLVQDIPGYDARMTLRPAGTVPGEVIGEVAVTYTPIEIDANVQNYGSRDVGRFGGLIRARFNGVTGMADTTTLSYYNTADFNEQHVLQASHSFRTGSEGLTLGGDFTYAWTRPNLGPGADFRTKTLIATLRATYPLLRSQTNNVLVGGGIDYVDQDVRFASVPLSRDKLRVLFARLDYDSIDPRSISSVGGYSPREPRWRFGGSLEARQGLSIFGASRACGATFVNCLPPNVGISKIEGDPTAFVLRATGYGELRPTPRITLALSPRVQWSSNPLLAFEEFSAGNYTIGRGYDPGTVTGDSGLGFQAELRVGSIVPRRIDGWAIQPFAFFDAAWVWNEDRLFPPYGRDPERLFSAGGGVRAAWGDHARLDAVLAAPLRRAGLQAAKGDVRFLMSLTVKLLPWTR